MDTSSSLMFLKPEEARRFLDKFGPERFFFGTDFPMWRHADELAVSTRSGWMKKPNK